MAQRSDPTRKPCVDKQARHRRLTRDGTDVAIDSSDITPISGALNGVVTAITLSSSTMRNIRQNLLLAFVYNGLGIPLAAGVLYSLTGMQLSPMIAAAGMAKSSLSVVANASRLRRWHPHSS